MNKKVINNAMSAYFWVGALLLLPSKKENINHPFVKKHARSAVFIHSLMLINYIIFISYSLLGQFSLYGYGVNHIIAALVFLGLSGWLLYGVSKASTGDDFSIQDMAAMSKADRIIEFKNSNLNEQWMLTIILSLVPFVGFTLRGKFRNYKSPILENNFKLNFIVSFFISLFFVYSYENLGLIFILIYTIFVVFYSVLLVSKNNLISLNLEKVPTVEDLYTNTIAMCRYLKNYFSGKEFQSLTTLISEQKSNFIQTENENKILLETYTHGKLPKYLYYIPFVNILGLVDIRSHYQFHVVYGILLSALSWAIWYFGYNNYQVLLFFPLAYGIGYTKILAYRSPLLYEIYVTLRYIARKVFSSAKDVKEKRETTQELSFTNTNV